MIWFNSESARKQLIDNGIVVTARKYRNTFGYDKAIYYNYKKDRIIIGKCDIKFLEYSDINDEDNKDHKRILSKYIELSGFNSVNEWVNEIRKLNNNRRLPEFLVLLKVVLI